MKVKRELDQQIDIARISCFAWLPFELHCALVQTLVGEVRTPGQWPHSRSHLHCAGQGVIYCVWFLAVRFIVILWRIYVGPRHDTFIVLTLGSSSSPQPTRSQARARVSQSEAGTGSRDQHAGHVCCYLGYGASSASDSCLLSSRVNSLLRNWNSSGTI